MKATKFIVLVGGILGILAFFLPMVTIHRADFNGSASAFQLIKGLNAASDVASSDEFRAAAMSSESVSQAKEGLDAMKGIVAAIFVPAIMLALIGAVGVKRKSFGRVAGGFSLLFGLIGLGIAALLKGAAGADAGVGLNLLMLTGVAGTLGGLVTLVKPDRKAAANTNAQFSAAAA